MKNLLRAASLAALLAVAACNLPQPQADTVRHFTLGNLAGATPVANPTQVRPVQLAGHLHGRSMAVRIAEHEVIYLEDVHWAEPLDGAVTQLLRTRLAAVAGGASVAVQVQRFELVRFEDNSVQLAATYSILPAEGDKGEARHGVFTATPRTWDGKDYGTLVGLMHDAAGELGEAIAAAVAEKK